MWLYPLFLVVYFYFRDPELLRRRLLRKEPLITQKILLFLLKLVTSAALVVSTLDYHFGWTRRWLAPVPLWLNLLALLILLACQIVIFRVMRANSFAASVVQIEAGQTIAATGPYHVVRHPMYAAWSIMWLFVPPALGSFVALPIGALVTLVFIGRLLNEEKLLGRDLAGYAAYCEKTPYRLIPFIW
jgi:protein-S-isoprenylcysteine O-methyltransferase Ste14